MRRSNIIGMLVLIGLLWWAPSPSEATIRTATTCSYADVNTQVSASVTGDTVVIPGGSCSWATMLDVGSKSITLQGNSQALGTSTQCAVGGQTTYTCLTMDATLNTGILQWTFIATGSPRITGITFDGGAVGSACVAATSGLLNLDGSTTTWRFDHNRIVARRCHGFVYAGSVVGVVDHNYLENRDGNFIAYVNHPGWGGGVSTCPNYGGGCGDRSWAAASGHGGSGFLFFEDNTFERGVGAAFYAIDGWKGQRMVVRSNAIVNITIQNHGTDSTGRPRGARAGEVYRNTFTINNVAFSAVIASRGGTGFYWGNEGTATLPGDITRMVDLNQYRLLVNPDTQECAYWGCADDPANNTFDQGVGTSNGYAAMDQIGRGQGVLLTGDEFTAGCTNPAHPAKCGVIPAGWPAQALEPVYAWDNNKNAVNSPIHAEDFSTGQYVVENRDYYTEGSLNGVKGSGLRASRSATCTTGQAYWSTDGGGNWNTTGADGGLDKCTDGTNGNPALRWTNDWYVPYTYPHPLQGAADTMGPAAPTGMTVVMKKKVSH